METSFRRKLFIVMMSFAIVISFSIAMTDHAKLREQVMENHQFQVWHTEEVVKDALRTIEKAYFLFGQDLAAKMEAGSRYLLDLYRENPHFDTWDFQNIKRTLDLDVYIINEQNVITHSSFETDIGLDFNLCCRNLAVKLDQIRLTGEVLMDGIDLEQQTGAVKKYSYVTTPDRKYILQTGYSLEESAIFNQFNFIETIDKLVEKYPSIDQIHVLNLGGQIIGKPVGEDTKLSPERRAAFEQALTQQEIVELETEWNGKAATYRYVPYVSEVDLGTTRHKVLEIIYNDQELKTVLREHKQSFLYNLLLFSALSVLLSFVISSWVSRPMYLAFHDSLTGLKNRAAFNETLKQVLDKRRGITALLMIDLDNFKLVNDYFGHDCGDQLLRQVAQVINRLIGKGNIAFRWGGDEFMIIMPETTQEEAERLARKIIATLQDTFSRLKLEEANITASIGLSFAPKHGLDPETLCKKADYALYASKEKGKNQYQIFTA